MRSFPHGSPCSAQPLSLRTASMVRCCHSNFTSESFSPAMCSAGLGLSFDQPLSKDLGVFIRAGWNDGKYATWAFTEIDRSASLGLSLKGAASFGWLTRDHRKLISVDGEVAFVSGLCVSRKWFGDPARGIEAWRDTGLR